MSRKNVAVASVCGLLVAVLAMMSKGQVALAPLPGFGDPLPGLSNDQLAAFNAGKLAFMQQEDVDEGLGPVFNEKGCAVCHDGGATGGGSTRLETRFGRTVNGVFDPLDGSGASGLNLGGSLMQDRGIGRFNGVKFLGEFVPAQANTVARRRTTPLFGLGLVENVPDQTLLDLQHQTGGVANVVFDVASGQRERVGRFGWKCQQATLLSFSGDAYLNEMGITTPMFPRENPPQGNTALLAADPFNPDPPLGDPRTNPDDVDLDDLEAFTAFMTFLAPPPRGAVTAQVVQGEAVFNQIGCAVCHQPELVTATGVRIHPYSDFLLHDMGSLNDGIAQPPAGPNQMRTAPLWGVRILSTFLHDGRAKSLTSAILAHDGEGSMARNNFANLNDNTQKAALLAFLNSL